MKRITYRSTAVLKKALGAMLEDFSYEKSVRLHRWHFSDNEGNITRTACGTHFLKALNEKFGCNIDHSRSKAFATKWIVTFGDEDSPLGDKEITQSDLTLAPKPSVATVEMDESAPVDVEPNDDPSGAPSLPEPECAVEVSLPTAPESVVEPLLVLKEDEVSDDTFNLTYAESLYSSEKQQSKDNLAEYASKFGVELKKNKKFEDMLSELVSRLDK